LIHSSRLVAMSEAHFTSYPTSDKVV
jgi:hypothetical protein